MEGKGKNRVWGRLFVLLAALLWSFSGVGVKLLPSEDALVITGFRSLFAIPVILLILGWVARPLHLGNIFPRSIRRGGVWGSAICYSLMVILFIQATRMTTAANAVFLQYSSPLFVALISRFALGEIVRMKEWYALQGCLLGLTIFFIRFLDFSSFTGNCLGVGAGVAAALNTVFLRYLARGNEEEGKDLTTFDRERRGLRYSLSAVVLGNVLVVAVCLPWMVARFPDRPFSWVVLILLGVFQLGLPYVLFSIGLSQISAIEAMLFAMVEAVLNPVWTALGVGEIPAASSVIGGGLILMSVTLYGILKSQAESNSGDAVG